MDKHLFGSTACDQSIFLGEALYLDFMLEVERALQGNDGFSYNGGAGSLNTPLMADAPPPSHHDFESPKMYRKRYSIELDSSSLPECILDALLNRL